MYKVWYIFTRGTADSQVEEDEEGQEEDEEFLLFFQEGPGSSAVRSLLNNSIS